MRNISFIFIIFFFSGAVYLFRHINLVRLFHRQILNYPTPKTSTPTVIVSASHLNQAGIAPSIEVSENDNLLSPQLVSSRINPLYKFSWNINIFRITIYNDSITY